MMVRSAERDPVAVQEDHRPSDPAPRSELEAGLSQLGARATKLSGSNQ